MFTEILERDRQKLGRRSYILRNVGYLNDMTGEYDINPWLDCYLGTQAVY